MVNMGTDVKIVGVVDEEPFDSTTWSGSSYYFFDSIRRSGHLHKAISAQPSKKIQFLYKLLSFNPNIDKWKFKYHIDVDYYKQMTKVALSKIKKMDDNYYNVILQVGAWYDLTGIKGKVTVSYHDGNLYTLTKSPYGYPKIHEKYIKKTLNYEARLYKKIDYIFPMSKWLAGSFIKDFGIKSDKVLPVGAGINIPLRYTTELNEKDYSVPAILFIGKDFKRKGGDDLLSAFKSVKREIPRATLTIIGPSYRINEEGVRNLGPISKMTDNGLKRIVEAYKEASIFVMPSLYEPFGIVFCEAMAFALPCVGANICAIPEIIVHQKSGLLVPPRDEHALSDALITLLKNPSMCKEMGTEGQLRYRNYFTWDAVQSRIVNAISSIL
jgi:glycosyltransferase involved in cell wall biosynthesis